MEAIRQIQHIQGNALSIVLPESFREQWVEVIVLPYTQVTLGTAGEAKRRPPPELADCEILGDIMAPTTEEADWDALK